MTVIERLKQLQEWRERQDPRLLERARAFAERFPCDDLQRLLQTLWAGHDTLLWTLLADRLQVDASTSTRYAKELAVVVRLLNWWSWLALRALQGGNEWAIAHALCAYEVVLEAFGASEATNLLRVCAPLVAERSRLLSAELLAQAHEATVADVFASALQQLTWQPSGNRSEPLRREARVGRNPSGTGRAQEHEKSGTSFLTSDDDIDPLEREPDPRQDPLAHVLRQETLEMLLNAAEGKTRQLLELMLEGYEVHEAAETIGITANSARVLLCKFRRKIREKSSCGG